MKMHGVFFCALLAMAVAMPAHADLIGSAVTGALYFQTGSPGVNSFDPVNGMVPPGYLNSGGSPTVTISEPAIEFGFNDGNGPVTANFTNTQLIISDLYTGSDANDPAIFVFTDPAFTGISLVSNNYPANPTYSAAHGIITINVASVPAANLISGTTYTAIFNVASSSVPEPSSLISVLVGILVCSFKVSRQTLK